MTLNVHPADGIRAFEDAYPMVAKRLGLDAEKKKRLALIFYSPAFREAYFEDVHHPLEDQGVDFGGLIGSKVVMARWIPFGC